MSIYVSIDLGSDSIAAYCTVRGGKKILIDLQHHAGVLLGEPSSVPAFLHGPEREADRSRRLKTRIALEDNRMELNDAHARLAFVDKEGVPTGDYRRALFGYFEHRSSPGAHKLLPNPKLLFHQAAPDIIPRVHVAGRGLQSKPYKAGEILCHMVAQIVNNFVFASPELRGIDMRETHLILSVPNIYTETHISQLRSFLTRILPVQEIDFTYESDAVAYYVLGREDRSDSAAVKATKRLLRTLDDQFRLCVIDIGRGTTDLSIIDITPSTGGDFGSPRHTILARTGRSDGGNALSYIFAGYYNACFLAYLHEDLGGYDHFLREKLSIVDYDLLVESQQYRREQAEIVHQFEGFIEQLKRNIGVHYTVHLSQRRQEALLDPLFNKLFLQLYPNFKADRAAGGNDARALDALRSDLRRMFMRRMVLSPDTRRSIPGIAGRLFDRARRVLGRSEEMPPGSLSAGDDCAAEDDASAQLRRKLWSDIRQYVSTSIPTLIDQLFETYAAREEGAGTIARWSSHQLEQWIHEHFSAEDGIVIVAGQASQFAPIANAIMKKFDSLALPMNRILFLKGQEAKEACCKGAITFKRSQAHITNLRELFGSYLLVQDACLPGTEGCVAIDTNKLNREQALESILVPPGCSMVYSTKPVIRELPDLGDGFTVELGVDLDEYAGKEVSMRIGAGGVILLDGEPVCEVSNYGSVQEQIYPMVWPELLLPQYYCD